MTTKLKFTDIVRMLRDREGWRLTERRKFLDDEAAYCDTGVYTYLECNGVRFRQATSTENPIVYEPGIFAGIFVIGPLTRRLYRYLKRTRSHG